VDTVVLAVSYMSELLEDQMKQHAKRVSNIKEANQ